ncbi:MAG: CBS domain-containing protein [Anaerolineae bacterium]|nr:CBS domain-containing protein [Anaerolineae bacterium]
MNVARILATKGTGIITIRPEQTVREAIALLAEHNIGALVAVDDRDQPVGIVSERDIVRAAADQEAELFSLSVSELMTKDVITGIPQDDLRVVAHTMTEKRFRHLPIVDKGKLIAIVSIGDVVKTQRDMYEGELDTLHTQILANEV